MVPYLESRMNRGTLAETDESIVRAGPRSSEGSRPYSRFTPGAEGVGCTRLHFPPATPPKVLQSSALQCMQVHGTLWGYTREFSQTLLIELAP